MWAMNKPDGFIAVETTHNGSLLLSSERRAGSICLAARKHTRVFSIRFSRCTLGLWGNNVVAVGQL